MEEKTLEAIKKGWGAVVELYKRSDKESRKLILKILSGLGGLVAFFKFLLKL